jgi:hypothetical protein
MSEANDTRSNEVNLDPDDRAYLRDGAGSIAAFLAGDPDNEGFLFRFLAKRLDGKIDAETWERVRSGLVSLVDENGTTLIGWSTTFDPSPLPAVEHELPVEVARVIRELTAMYGPELRVAYERSSELPDNWRFVHREIYHDLLLSRPYIRLRIEKFSGEETIIEGPGDSILSLARSIIIALRLVPGREDFSEDRIEQYLEEADELARMLRPEEAVPVAPEKLTQPA